MQLVLYNLETTVMHILDRNDLVNIGQMLALSLKMERNNLFRVPNVAVFAFQRQASLASDDPIVPLLSTNMAFSLISFVALKCVG